MSCYISFYIITRNICLDTDRNKRVKEIESSERTPSVILRITDLVSPCQGLLILSLKTQITVIVEALSE